MMNSFARWMVRHPLAVIAANLLVTVDPRLLRATHPRRKLIDERLARGRSPGRILCQDLRDLRQRRHRNRRSASNDLFAPSTLEKIARVTDALAKIKGVSSVASSPTGPICPRIRTARSDSSPRIP